MTEQSFKKFVSANITEFDTEKCSKNEDVIDLLWISMGVDNFLTILICLFWTALHKALPVFVT